MSNEDLLDLTEEEKRKIEAYKGDPEDDKMVPLTNPKGDSNECDRCKGDIGMMDVEGHYSGRCAHCRKVYGGYNYP